MQIAVQTTNLRCLKFLIEFPNLKSLISRSPNFASKMPARISNCKVQFSLGGIMFIIHYPFPGVEHYVVVQVDIKFRYQIAELVRRIKRILQCNIAGQGSVINHAYLRYVYSSGRELMFMYLYFPYKNLISRLILLAKDGRRI